MSSDTLVNTNTDTIISKQPVPELEPLNDTSPVMSIMSNVDNSSASATKEPLQLLFEYVMSGNIDEFKNLLETELSKAPPEENVDTLFRDRESQATLTHKCARYNQPDMLDLLLAKGASLESMDLLDATPIMYCAASGSSKSCSWLLSKGAQPNVRDKYQMSPLILAMKNKHFETASLLLLGGADIHFKGPRGNSALHLACEEGNLEKVKFLLDNGAVITRTNQKSQSCLFSALKHQPCVQYLLEALASGEGGGKTVYRQLLTRDDQTRSVIHHCIEFDYFFTLQFLIHYLSQQQNKNCLKEFVNDKEQLFGNSPVHLCVNFSRLEMLKILVDTKEVQIDAQNNVGNTCLHLAINNNNTGMAQYLIHVAKASKSVKNKNKETPSQLSKDKKMEIKKFTMMHQVMGSSLSSSLSEANTPSNRKSLFANLFAKKPSQKDIKT